MSTPTNNAPTSSSSTMPPITREVLKELYLKNPATPLSPHIQQFIQQLTEANAELLKLGGPLPATSGRGTTEEEPPHRIDENLWRIREECELVEFHLAKLSSEKALQNTALHVKNAATDVTNYQQNVINDTLKRVESFLPQDFRLSMIRYTKERKENAFKAEVDTLVQNGGTIEEKYKLLWGQQLQRREALIQLSNASGMWKTLISYLAGCPVELLDFIKKLNDPAGPMEEFRLAFGLHIYTLLRLATKLRVASYLLANLPKDASAAKYHFLLEQCSESFAKETKATTNHLYVVTKLSPFFVEVQDESDTPKEVSVAAWGAYERKRVVTKGTLVKWDWSTKNADIGFQLSFIGEKTIDILPAKRYNSHVEGVKGEHTAPDNGTYLFKWDNTYSWTTAKVLVYRIEVKPPASSTAPPASPEPKP